MATSHLKRLYAFEATSHLTANLMPHGNVALQATFMPMRQLGTSNDLYAFEATSHLITNLILHGNISLYHDLHAS